MADVPLFSQLLPFSWRGINFPVTAMSVRLQQDLAVHKAWGRDGGIAEPTGRDVLVFSASIPFRNSVWSGQSETYGVLYPAVWRLFLQAMADKSIGILQHPELGEVECAPQRAEVSWDPNRRDGCDVQAEWVETTENEDRITNIDGMSPVVQASAAMGYADAAIRLDADDLPKRPEFKPTLADALRAVQGIGNQAALKAGWFVGQVDALKWRLDELLRVYQAGGDPRRVTTVMRLAEAHYALDRMVTGETREISYWRVPQDSTWAGIAQQLGKPMPRLMALNPRLLQQAVIARDTAIRYER